MKIIITKADDLKAWEDDAGNLHVHVTPGATITDVNNALPDGWSFVEVEVSGGGDRR